MATMLLNQFKTGSSVLGAHNGEVAASSSSSRASRVAVRSTARRDVQVRASASAGGFFRSVSSGVTTLTNKVGSVIDKVVHIPGKDDPNNVHYKATITISKKLLALDLVDRMADLKDDASEILGQHVSVQLVSTQTDPKTGKPMLSNEMAIQNWITTKDLVAASDFDFPLEYYVPKGFGVPGAIIVKNQHPNEFQLVKFSIALPDSTVAYYTTNSWVYNTNNKEGRIFFHNKAYLPSETPAGLKELRDKELQNLRGDGKGQREVQDRIYDYEVYNDLGNPDQDPKWTRPNLGGNQTTPYPRRCRTGRPPSKTSPQFESRETDPKKALYIPRDERFDRVKNSDFQADTYRSKLHAAPTSIKDKITKNTEFDSLQEIRDLFAPKGADLGGLNNLLPNAEDIPPEDQHALVFLQEMLKPGGQPNEAFRYPLPKILQVDQNAWEKDEEFAREFLAGLNPIVIKLVEEFPVKSKHTGPELGDPVSTITAKHIEGQMEGLNVEQALEQKKLFVADYVDTFLPYINKINEQEGSAMCAARALLFLTSDQTLKVLALELVMPPKTAGGEKSARVFTPPPPNSPKNWVWELAKAHVQNNDIFIHQVMSHFTRCHAVSEPYLLATNRQLSALHPLHQLLHPHYKSTMETNIAARAALINAGGIIETVFTPQRYSMELSAVDYGRNWTFDLQALPNDLINRGMAVPDAQAKHGVKLVVEDYPYAADGLELWDAINSWNTDYVDIYYADDASVQKDVELQNWWTEIRTVGHGDKKDSPGWPEANSKKNLAHILSTIQWVVSCQHAAVNFGQYHYGGFMPHHPTSTRRLVPEVDTPEWKELHADPEKFYLSSLSNTTITTTVMSVYEVLSSHSADEEYIGQRSNANWTENEKVKTAFKAFGDKIKSIDALIVARNADKSLKNRTGPAQYPYELQRTTSPPGMTGKGIPNSITI